MNLSTDLSLVLLCQSKGPSDMSPYVTTVCTKWFWITKLLQGQQSRVNRNLYSIFHLLRAYWQPLTTCFSKYAQRMLSENCLANEDILGRLHDILRLFINYITRFILIQNRRKFKFYFLFMTSNAKLDVDPMFLLLSWRLRIWSFGRRACSII